VYSTRKWRSYAKPRGPCRPELNPRRIRLRPIKQRSYPPTYPEPNPAPRR